VLFRLVADNESVARALFMAVHLTNTFVLLACLTLTAHWCSSDSRPRLAQRRAWPLVAAALALLLVGTSGAVAALGDTLYPARSLLGALAADVSPTAHFLVRLRVAHPLLAPSARWPCRTGEQRCASDSPRCAAWSPPASAAARRRPHNVVLLSRVLQLVRLLLADLVWIRSCRRSLCAQSAPSWDPKSLDDRDLVEAHRPRS
jgi:heme A synthase